MHANLILVIAGESETDPRTVKRYLELGPESVRPASRVRIERAPSLRLAKTRPAGRRRVA